MYLLFNNQVILEKELRLPFTNRAFQYNDGFFETVMVIDGKLRFWNDHISRMQDAAQTLRLELPSLFFSETFEQALLSLAASNGALAIGRLKLKVWRTGEGLYTPLQNGVDWLAIVQPAVPASEKGISIGICQHVRTIYSPFSRFKGPNSPVYVLASLEKKEQDVEDILLLDQKDYVAELTSSNIFWLKDNILYTPSLQTGCINGIMRRNILKWCKAEELQAAEVLVKADSLLHADTVFAANVTGIRNIYFLDGYSLNHNSTLIARFRQRAEDYK